jgi:hypothetical protein
MDQVDGMIVVLVFTFELVMRDRGCAARVEGNRAFALGVH